MLPTVFCLLSLFAVGAIKAAPSLTSVDPWCKSEVLPKAVGELSQYMDRSVKPCNDFYQFVCGRSSGNVKEVLEARIKEFSKKFHQRKVEKNSDLNDVRNKARLHYQMCMDWETRRKRGVEPLLEYTKATIGFDPIKQEFVTNNFDWLNVVAKLAGEGSSTFFSVYYDRQNVTFYKNPFLSAMNKSEVRDILIETGLEASVASKTAEEVVKLGVDLESLTKKSDTPILEKLNFQELKTKVTGIDWERYFKTADGHPPSQQIVLFSPSYFNSLQKKLSETSPKTIANYIFMSVLLSTLLLLDGRYNEIHENMANPHGKKYDADPEYWCRRTSSYWISDAVDSAYAREFFSGNNKTEATELVENLKRAFVENDWSDAKTKQEISKNLAKMNIAVGYPDYLLSDEVINERFKDLKIVSGKYYESQTNAVRNRKLIDRRANTYSTWGALSPTFVNINGGPREITVPAGRLQPPYYHHCYPKALNFGSVGTLIAEEMAQGVGKTSSCSTKQSSIHVPDTESVRIAYKAYKDWVKKSFPTGNLALAELQDVNDEQLFFIAYAHGWCGSNKQEAEQLIRSALSKLPEFADAFNCPTGSNMNPEKSTVDKC